MQQGSTPTWRRSSTPTSISSKWGVMSRNRESGGSFAFFEIRDKVEGLMAEMEELAGHMEVCNAILAVASTKEGCAV